MKQKMEKAYIICYHRINNDDDSYLRPTKVNNFEKQMQYIAKEYNPISLEKIIQAIKNKEKLPKNSIAVTFDDGYKDIYENAYPILKKYSIPATVFLTVGYIGTNKLLFWDKIYNILRSNKIKNKKIKLPLLKNIEFDMSNNKRIVYDIVRKMKPLSNEERENFIADISSQLNIQDKHNDRLMLSWDEVMLMSNNNISFGSHTCTHPLLTNIPRDKAYEEMLISKKIIEQYTGKNVTTLAYPGGDFDPIIASMAKEIKYLAAVSTIPGSNNLKTDLFSLRRNNIGIQEFAEFYSFSVLTFKAEIIGLTNYAKKIFHNLI